MVLSSAPFYSFVPLPPYILHKSFKYLVEKPQVSLLPHFDVTPPIESFEEDIQSPLKFGSSISALYPPFSFFDFTSRLQRFGETLFAAAIVISLIQAALALYQYRSNPSGELAFPPGLTCGVAYPTRLDSSDGSLIRKTSADTLKKNQSPFHQIHTFSEDSDRLLNEQHKDKQPSTYTRTLFKVNRMMVLLYPWIAQHIRAIVIKNAHIFHIFFIISLASAFNFWRSGPIGIDNGGKSSVIANLSDSTKKERKVIVIGDSLAVGIGSVEYFDENKNNTLPMFRVERLSHDDRTLNTALLDRNIDISPVFPRVFAQTLANRLEQRIRWRSAGVDGGDVSDIINFCSGVIEEESKFGHPPDVVVVICGINDLKKTVSNPFKSKSARGFRSSMEDMINEIRKHAPNASIIFPALPVQMFYKNSAVNILPLSLFLDAICGFWDSQKKLVASRASSNVIHLGLSAREIIGWYDDENEEGKNESNILIAPDGIHPNTRCYSKWASSMGNKFCDRVLTHKA